MKNKPNPFADVFFPSGIVLALMALLAGSVNVLEWHIGLRITFVLIFLYYCGKYHDLKKEYISIQPKVEDVPGNTVRPFYQLDDGSGTCTYMLEDLAEQLAAEGNNTYNQGREYKVIIVRMTQDEYEQLPEYEQ